MGYKCIGENWGQALIEAAIAAGYTVEIVSEDDVLYRGADAAAAWQAALEVDDVWVFLRAEGKRTERAYLVFEYGQEGDEVINDHSVGGWIEAWWNAKYEAAAP